MKRNKTKWYFAKWYFAKHYFAKWYVVKWYFAKCYFANWYFAKWYVVKWYFAKCYFGKFKARFICTVDTVGGTKRIKKCFAHALAVNRDLQIRQRNKNLGLVVSCWMLRLLNFVSDVRQVNLTVIWCIQSWYMTIIFWIKKKFWHVFLSRNGKKYKEIILILSVFIQDKTKQEIFFSRIFHSCNYV